jgi:hypothetical protein
MLSKEDVTELQRLCDAVQDDQGDDGGGEGDELVHMSATEQRYVKAVTAAGPELCAEWRRARELEAALQLLCDDIELTGIDLARIERGEPGVMSDALGHIEKALRRARAAIEKWK